MSTITVPSAPKAEPSTARADAVSAPTDRRPAKKAAPEIVRSPTRRIEGLRGDVLMLLAMVAGIGYFAFSIATYV